MAIIRIKPDPTGRAGNIRGLLYDDCNLGLGKFRDNVDYLQSAVQYLVNQ